MRDFPSDILLLVYSRVSAVEDCSKIGKSLKLAEGCRCVDCAEVDTG